MSLLAKSSRVILRASRASPARAFGSSSPAFAASYKDDDANLSIVEKGKKMFGISKQHTKAAMKNQGQAMDDISSGRTSVTDELKEHGKAAGHDMKQWGHELKETAKGNFPETAKVRDLPPRYEGEKVADEVSRKPVKEGSQTDSTGFRKM
jgi:hypothetical protein